MENEIKEPPAFLKNVDEMIKKKLEADQILRESLLNANWPIWLYPQEFDQWVKFENWCRKTAGIMMLPSPPREVIAKVLENGNGLYI